MTATNDQQQLAERIVARMMAHDAFSQWLGLDILDVRPAHARVRMRVRDEMVNGFGVAHGGIVFSLADSAFAFACNTHGQVTVSIDNTVTYPRAIHPGDELTAVADEEAVSNRLAWFRVEVRNQRDELVAVFRGTAYRTSRSHESTSATHE